MSMGGSFITKEFVKKHCACDDMPTCISIAEALKNNNLKLAEDLFANLNK